MSYGSVLLGIVIVGVLWFVGCFSVFLKSKILGNKFDIADFLLF